MGAAFFKCCLDASEDTKNNRISSAFEVVGDTCSESSITTNNESVQVDEDLTLDEDVAVSHREKKMLRWNSDTEVDLSEEELRLSKQEMPLDTRDTILEDLIRKEELALITMMMIKIFSWRKLVVDKR
mmetsp:Transcript_899/g.1853  ORF Transcript_899/g.1853 Transcript_899/m.1853 type:complete len:128 (+) Transcript_899:238-621(+)